MLNLSRDLTVSCFLEADRRFVGFVFFKMFRIQETNFPIEIDFPLRLQFCFAPTLSVLFQLSTCCAHGTGKHTDNRGTAVAA